MMANITGAIDDKLEGMLHSIKTNISQHLKEISDQVEEAEGRILAVENSTSQAEKHIAVLTKSATELTEHLQDYENRGRRKNLRILGICEKAEGSDMVKFMEKWIPQIVDMETKAGHVKLERAHCTTPSYHHQVPQLLRPSESYGGCPMQKGGSLRGSQNIFLPGFCSRNTQTETSVCGHQEETAKHPRGPLCYAIPGFTQGHGEGHHQNFSHS